MLYYIILSQLLVILKPMATIFDRFSQDIMLLGSRPKDKLREVGDI